MLDLILAAAAAGARANEALRRAIKGSVQPAVDAGAGAALLRWGRDSAGRSTITAGEFHALYFTGTNSSYPLRQLEACGLIASYRQADDRRVVRLVITAAGRHWCDEIGRQLELQAPAGPLSIALRPRPAEAA